jgi:hypoxanthine phosphoribosyltransferase
VLIVEDIIDTGRTLEYLTRLLRARRPASLKTCSLLLKEQSIRLGIRVDYLGFTIPDDWLVGYGLDCADRFRALPYIASLSPATRKLLG